MSATKRIAFSLVIILLAIGAVASYSYVEEPSEIIYGELVMPAGLFADNTINISSPNGIVPAKNNPSTILMTGMDRWTVGGGLNRDKDRTLTFTGFFANLSEVPDLYVNHSHDNEYFFVKNFTSETKEIAGRNVTYLSAEHTGAEHQMFGRGIEAIEIGVIDKDTYDHRRAILDDHNIHKDVDYQTWRSPWYSGEAIELRHTLTEQERLENKVWRITISVRC